MTFSNNDSNGVEPQKIDQLELKFESSERQETQFKSNKDEGSHQKENKNNVSEKTNNDTSKKEVKKDDAVHAAVKTNHKGNRRGNVSNSKKSTVIKSDPKALRMKYLDSNQDLLLKIMVSELYAHMGYATFIETDISTYNYGNTFRRETVSDIDVLAIKYDFDLRNTTVIIECKSGEQEALNHLLKLDGICRLRNATYGVLVQNRIPSNSREVASQLGHTTWDQSEILSLLKSTGIWKQGLEDQLIDVFIQRAELQKGASREFPKFSKFLNTDYWLAPEFRNIQSIVTGLAQLKSSYNDKIDVHRFLVDQAALLFMVSSIKATHSILQNYVMFPQERLKDYLFGGARERKEREVLFDKINQHMGEKTTFLPAYFDSYTELILRYVSTPFFAKDVPFIWSQFINRQFNGQRSMVESVSLNADPVALKLTRDAIRFLTKILGHRPSNWDAFLNS